MERFVTSQGASFNVAHLLSFKRQKDFVDAYVDVIWKHTDRRERRLELGKMYKEAKRIQREQSAD